MFRRLGFAVIASALVASPTAVFAQYRDGGDRRDAELRRQDQNRPQRSGDVDRRRNQNRENVRDFNDWWYEDYNDGQRGNRRGGDDRRDRDRRDDVRDYNDWWYEDYNDGRRGRRGGDDRRDRNRRDDVRDYNDWWYEDYNDGRRGDRRGRDVGRDGPYSWHDGRWWYRMPQGYWMYHEGGEWRRNRVGSPYPPTERPRAPQYRSDRRYDGRYRSDRGRYNDDVQTGARIGSEIGGAIGGQRGAQAGANIGAAIGRATDN